MSKLKVDEIRSADRSVSSTANITLADDGTLSTGNLKVPNDGNIGSAGQGGAVKITSAGVITKPYTPYFMTAGLAQNVGVNDYFRWNNATGVHNVGGHFVQGTGTAQTTCSYFKTPVAGVYLFSVSFMMTASTATGHYHADLLINDQLDHAGTIAIRWMDIKFTTTNAHVQFNGSYMSYLTADQYCKMQLSSSPNMVGSGSAAHNYWSGILLG